MVDFIAGQDHEINGDFLWQPTTLHNSVLFEVTSILLFHNKVTS